MQKLLDIPAGQLLASGIFPSLVGKAPAFWADGKNILFEDGGVRNANGQVLLGALATRPTGIATALALAERRAYVGSGTTAYKYTTGSGLVSIGTVGSAGGIWTFAPAGTVTLLSNGIEQVEYWPNTGASAAITTAAFGRAQLLAKYFEYFLAADTNLDNNVVYNSDFADPEEWGAGTAGNRPIRDMDGGIKQFARLGQYMGIYSPNELYEMHLTGDTSRFAVNRLLKGVGAISPYSVVDVNGQHYGLLLEGAFTTNGASYEPIDEPAMRKYLRQNFDTSQAQKVFGWYDQANRMVRWIVPKSSGRVGIGFRLDSGTWTRFEDDFSIGIGPGVWDDALLGAGDGLYREARTTYSMDGDAISSYVQTKPLDCSLTDRYKQFEALEFDGAWSGTVLVDLGFCDKPTEAITWAYTDMPIDEVVNFEPREAPHAVLKIHSNAVGAQWEIKGLRLYGEPTGYWA